MTGTLKAKVNGSWVPILGGGPQAGALGIVVMSAMKVQTTITGSATTVTPISERLNCYLAVGRRYRILGNARAFGYNNVTNTGNVALYDNGTDTTQLDQWFAVTAPASYTSVTFEVIYDGDGQSHSFDLRSTNSSLGVNFYGGAGTRFYCEDVGPNSYPALPIPATPPAWTPITLTNGWKNNPSEQAAQYRKIGDVVTLRGPIDGGSLQGVAFTLPVGFRPPLRVHHSTGSWNLSAWIPARGLMDPDGTYRPWDGGLFSHPLDGLSFSTTA